MGPGPQDDETFFRRDPLEPRIETRLIFGENGELRGIEFLNVDEYTEFVCQAIPCGPGAGPTPPAE